MEITTDNQIQQISINLSKSQLAKIKNELAKQDSYVIETAHPRVRRAKTFNTLNNVNCESNVQNQIPSDRRHNQCRLR